MSLVDISLLIIPLSVANVLRRVGTSLLLDPPLVVKAMSLIKAANAINCKFVNVSARIEPLDFAKLPAFHRQEI